MRYRFLEKKAVAFRIHKILTAHHADDQAETFLMRWLQGAGLRGLGGMAFERKLRPESDIVLVRPLLLMTRKEIEAYARFHRLRYREDATNNSDFFLRSRIRKLFRRLKKENPNLEGRTAFNALALQADETYLSKAVDEVWKKHGKFLKKGAAFALLSYKALEDAIRYRILQKMARVLLGEAYALPFETVLKLDEMLRVPGHPKSFDLPSTMGLWKGKDAFKIFKKPG